MYKGLMFKKKQKQTKKSIFFYMFKIFHNIYKMKDKNPPLNFPIP